MLEYLNYEPEPAGNIASNVEAERHLGASWRRPTEEELEELAIYFAKREVKAVLEDMGEVLDEAELTIAVNRRELELVEQTRSLTMVQDLVKINVQIFYMYDFIIKAAEISGTLVFDDGLCIMIKKDGELELHGPTECRLDLLAGDEKFQNKLK